jgi:predicted RNA binding protein YcfA (HicA-like mRNA interferase family)
MPSVGPIKRRDLVKYLKQIGFSNPRPGGNYEYMKRGRKRVKLPNPHQGDVSQPLLIRILKEAGISREEWEAL